MATAQQPMTVTACLRPTPFMLRVRLACILLLLCALSVLPFCLAFGHPAMPWPLRLIGADVSASHLAAHVRAHAAALASARQQSAEQQLFESRVAALAAGLQRLPAFGGAGAAAAPAPRLHLCTVASRTEPGLDLLRATAELHGLPLTVLGLGDAQIAGWGRGLGRKAIHMATFVAGLPPSDLVLMVDAYDAVLMGRPSVEAYFRGLARALLREPLDPASATEEQQRAQRAAALAATGSGGSSGSGSGPEPLLASRRPPALLFSAESECMILKPPPGEEPEGQAGQDEARQRAREQELRTSRSAPYAMRYPCLNSGGFMGPAGELHRLLTAVPWERYMENDQVGFYHALARSRARSDLPLLVLDHDNELFLTARYAQELEGAVVAAEGGGWGLPGGPPAAHPAVWHYPSHFKRLSGAVGLLTGRLGQGGGGELRRCMEMGWALAAAAFCGGAAFWSTLAGLGGGGGGGGGGEGSSKRGCATNFATISSTSRGSYQLRCFLCKLATWKN